MPPSVKYVMTKKRFWDPHDRISGSPHVYLHRSIAALLLSDQQGRVRLGLCICARGIGNTTCLTMLMELQRVYYISWLR